MTATGGISGTMYAAKGLTEASWAGSVTSASILALPDLDPFSSSPSLDKPLQQNMKISKLWRSI